MKNETKHTPGPWRIEDGEEGGYRIHYSGLVSNGASVVVGQLISGYTPSLEDARLIAAAPELLAALENALEDMRKHYACLPDDPGTDEMRQARAAIAKAKGE